MQNETKIPRFPVKVLAFALVLTGAVVAWSAWNVYHSYSETKGVLERNITLEKLRDTIVHLDSVLTMSARIAASSGKMEWEERYLKFARELDDAIKEARTLAPDAYSAGAAAQTDEANLKLVDMEKRSFELARRGRLEEAQAILSSDEYNSQKRIYAQGMTRFASGLADKASATLEAEELKARRHNAVIVIIAALLLGGWLAALKRIRKWRTSLVEKNRLLIDEINERHRVEEALVTSEKVYRDLVSSSLVGIYQTNLKGDILYANEALARIFGFDSAEELVSKNASGMYRNPDERKKFIETLRETGEITDYELEIVTKTGNPGYVLASATLTGEVLSGMIMDITARKIAEAATRAAITEANDERARSEAIIAGIGDGISIQDKNFKVIYQNRVHKNIFGEHPGKLCYKAYCGVDDIVEDCPLAKTYGDGRIHWAERSVEFDTGTKYFDITASPLRDGTGEITGGIEVVRDITGRRKFQNRREHLNRLLEDLFALSGLGAKLTRITDGVVDIFGADFARIWITKPGDLCSSGCVHAETTEGPHVCRDRDRCLHLAASSGRYTHTDGEVHRRVPYGCYKIGRLAAGKEPKSVTNDLIRDPRVHNHEWARKLGLVSFAGYRLTSANTKPIGVLALFSKHPITEEEYSLLEGLANSTTQVIMTAMAEEALKDAIVRAEDEKTKTETILAGIGDGISIQGSDFKILYQNKIHRDMFGCQVGGNCLGTFEPDTSGGCCAVVMCFKDGRVHKAERKMVTDGKTQYFEITAAPLRDASGKITSGVEVVRDITKRRSAEEQLRKRSHDIGEFVKELNCLYGASRLMAEQDLPQEEVFEEIVRLIPESMGYPEITCARISYEQRRFKTPNFKETPWKLTSEIFVSGEKCGTVDVCYLKEMPERDEGPFQVEERKLLDALARTLGEFIERKIVEEKLRHRTHDLDERVKDLNCLYGASRVMAEPGLSQRQVFEKTLRLIPASWQHPEITCAAITLDGLEYKTKNFRKTRWKMSSEIDVSGEKAGTLEVRYLKKIPHDHEEPFQTEERELLDALARELGRFVERKRAEEEMKSLASTDKLTGVFNRTKFDEIIEREVERAKRFEHPLAIIMFDIDHFKEINDTHGHLTGDAVLRDIAALVSKLIRKIDFLVRWGGEEFVIIAPETRLDRARELAERIRKAIAKNRFDGTKGVSASFGVTTLKKSDNIDQVLTRVDNALYKAKSSGRNQVEISE